MRALAAALLLLATSLIGFGFGPLLIGRLSDVLAVTYGADSLRVALLIVPVLYAWAACHYYSAARAPLASCGIWIVAVSRVHDDTRHIVQRRST